ncbi:hypothetical protein HYPSUDRAFT_199926 [Hypholoma sublateritium FD-334 SS-4]|uniref:Uncharacterized protein n=1 Tax=Hypholoma sublateritium (strain FD-334 SS-4) TaxID=945553 RepID=A0A0D2MN76_HYPSF|nr:hypothetical protein HYPSUDRAFT_199926 [Hypholoma sublateritium FD-334 SS-4]
MLERFGGIRTTWVQPPGDDSNIDPVLLEEDRRARLAAASQSQPQRERSFGSEVSNQQEPSATPSRTSQHSEPKPSSSSREAAEKVKIQPKQHKK